MENAKIIIAILGALVVILIVLLADALTVVHTYKEHHAYLAQLRSENNLNGLYNASPPDIVFGLGAIFG